MKFGETIKKLRKAKNLSLSDVSKQTGIQLATLSRIEHNKMAGTLQAHEKIAEVLGLKLSTLFEKYEKDSTKLTLIRSRQ